MTAAVVRTLTTVLNFRLDRTQLDRFERTLVGIRTRTKSTLGVITDYVSQSFDFLSNISKSAVATEDLAKYSGISVKNLAALRSTTSKLGIPADKFNASIKKISLGIKEASRGSGFLLDVIRNFPQPIQLFQPNGQLRDAKDILLQILKGVGKIKDQSEQLRILENFFDPETAARWLEIILLGEEKLTQLLKNEEGFAISFEKSIESAKEFNQQINTLSTNFTNLKQNIGLLVLPKVNDFLGALSNDFANLLRYFNGEKLELKEGVAYPSHYLERNQNLDRMIPQHTQGNELSCVNNVTINTQPGTTDNQISYMQDALKQVLNQDWDEKVRQVINNHPVVER